MTTIHAHENRKLALELASAQQVTEMPDHTIARARKYVEFLEGEPNHDRLVGIAEGVERIVKAVKAQADESPRRGISMDELDAIAKDVIESATVNQTAIIEAQKRVINAFVEAWEVHGDFNLRQFAERFKAQLDAQNADR